MVDLPRAQIEAFLRDPVASFVPWVGSDGVSPQRELIRAASKSLVEIYRAGNRCGKTTWLTWDATARLKGLHPFDRRRPPLHTWLIGLDRDHGVRLLWDPPGSRGVRHWLGADLARSTVSWVRKTDPAIPETVVLPNGSTLTFMSADSGREKFQGASLDHIGADEEMDKSIISECRARLVDRRGTLALALTPISRKVWVRDLEREPGTVLVRASMRQAASSGVIDAQAVSSYLATLGERERMVRELGDFAALEGLVYPEFDRAVHVLRPRGNVLMNAAGEALYPWPLPVLWPRVASMDLGYGSPAACIRAARAIDGALIIDRVFYAAGVRITTWARVLKSELPPLREYDHAEDGRGRLVRRVACDHDAGDRAELEAGGVETEAARKEIEAGLAAVARRWVARTLYLVIDDENPPINVVTGRCDAHQLAWELDGYRYRDQLPDRPTVKDQPLKKDDHACDALRYLVMAEDAGGAFFGDPSLIGRRREEVLGFFEAVTVPKPPGW